MGTPIPRKPFVDTFRQEVANGFLIAGGFSSAYHFANDGIQAVCKNVPRMSCSAAVFFGIYEAIDYAMVSARRKEEPVLNCAVAIGGASGIMTFPKGVRSAGRSALIGGAIGVVLSSGLRLLEDRRRTPNLLPQKVGDPCLSCGR